MSEEPAAEPLEPEEAPGLADQPPVAVLKSGVVDGMAYTLYVDGSIEAELPQGTLRFASINELRDHLEKQFLSDAHDALATDAPVAWPYRRRRMAFDSLPWASSIRMRSNSAQQ